MFTKVKTNAVHELIMEQIKDVEACLVSFESFLRAASTQESGDETLRSLYESVYAKEDAADISLRRMIDSLAGSAFLPATREDLISIATSCDGVANKCEHTAMMIVYQRFRYPEAFANDLLEIIAVTHEQFVLLEKSISALFAKFGDLLKDHTILDEIRKRETRVDAIEQKLYEQIFRLDMDLAHQMQVANFVEWLCDLSDMIENIADKIQIMLVTRKN